MHKEEASKASACILVRSRDELKVSPVRRWRRVLGFRSSETSRGLDWKLLGLGFKVKE